MPTVIDCLVEVHHLVRHEISMHTPTWCANCQQKIFGNPPRGMPTMVDCLVEVHVIRNYMVIETQDLYRFRPSV